MTGPRETLLADTPSSINSSSNSAAHDSLSSSIDTSARTNPGTTEKRGGRLVVARGLVRKRSRRAGMVARGCPRTGSAISASSLCSSSPLTREELVEMRRLAALLPPTLRPSPTTAAVNGQLSRRGLHGLHGRLDPLEVLNNTMRYIDQLESTVAARVQNGTLPRDALGHPSSTTPSAAHRRRVAKRKKSGARKLTPIRQYQ